MTATAIPTPVLWTVILGLAVGSYALRFLFIGLVGDRPLPPWLLKLLRYTAVSILPALVTPLVIWPAANDGQTDPIKLIAAFLALSVAYVSKNVLVGVAAGALALAFLPAAFF